MGVTYRDAMACQSYVMVPLTLALVILSISLRTWASSEVTDNAGLSGDVQIGLWKACADMPCENVIVTEGDDIETTCSKSEVFTDLGECRNGHCIGGGTLSLFTSWESNDLCNRSAAAAAFGIITLLLIVYNFYLTTYKEIRRLGPGCGDGEYETAAWVNLLAAVCAVICWAIFNRWVKLMNDEAGPTRAKDTDSLEFTDLTTGFGMSVMLISWILLFVNTILCVMSANEQGVMARRKLPPTVVSESAEGYLDVGPEPDDYEPPAGARMGRRTSTSDV